MSKVAWLVASKVVWRVEMIDMWLINGVRGEGVSVERGCSRNKLVHTYKCFLLP